jgi:hypothetical protein
MTSQPSLAGGLPPKPAAPAVVLLTPKEAAKLLKVSLSWLAKARICYSPREDRDPCSGLGDCSGLWG